MMQAQSQRPDAPPTRRYDLDWLRVLAILVVFVFHSGRFFDLGDWHVKNPTTYLGVQIWTTFLANWLMPLIFVISGASTFYALGARRAGRFVKDRSLRLLVPLAVGSLTHVMIQVYLERVSHGQFRGSLLAFIPHYFDGLYGFGGNFAWMGLHLWYLEVLFIFSLVLLPLFGWLKHGAGQRVAARLSSWLARPLAVYLLALPIMLLLNLLDPETGLGRRDFGGWSLPIYMFFFMYGFLLVGSDAAQQGIARQRWLSLALGIIAFLTLSGVYALFGEPAFGAPRFMLVFSLFGLSSWCWVLAFLGFGIRRLNFNSAWLQYANEAVLPFYVLHQSVLIYLGYFVVQWPLPDFVKWLVIAPASFAIILTLYKFLVRRINVLRFLFGMKPLPKAAARQALRHRLGSA